MIYRVLVRVLVFEYLVATQNALTILFNAFGEPMVGFWHWCFCSFYIGQMLRIIGCPLLLYAY